MTGFYGFAIRITRINNFHFHGSLESSFFYMPINFQLSIYYRLIYILVKKTFGFKTTNIPLDALKETDQYLAVEIGAYVIHCI